MTELLQMADVLAQEREMGTSTLETKHVRVRQGVYAMKGGVGRYVIRVRAPAGILSSDQLSALASILELAPEMGNVHLTTRQGIEFSGVPTTHVVEVLSALKRARLTTLNTGGNAVRGTVCCPVAGVSPTSVFDCTPVAVAVDHYFRRHSSFQSMPRKIKISFESCMFDHVRTALSDIGLSAKMYGDLKGFSIRVGGGLGAMPMIAQELDDFVHIDMILLTIEAILTVFDREGNRHDRAHARLKWLIRSMGIEEFRQRVNVERDKLREKRYPEIPEPAAFKPSPSGAAGESRNNPAFERWRRFSVKAENRQGYVTVFVRVPLGNLSPVQLRFLASAHRSFSKDSLRVTIEQNVALRSVHVSYLPSLYEVLNLVALDSCCAEQITDITRCVGGSTCLSAITDPSAASRALSALFGEELFQHEATRSLRIRISGCTNSCSHHHATDIGLQGASKRVNGHAVPHYVIFLGGETSHSRLARRIIQVPARNIKETIRRIIRNFLDERRVGEDFTHWVERTGVIALRTSLADLATVPDFDGNPSYYRDLEAGENFVLNAGEGECWA